MARRGSYSGNSRRGFSGRSRRRNKRDEGIGGLIIFGGLFAWYVLGHAWAIGIMVFLAILAVAAGIVVKRRQHQRLTSSGIASIDQMDGRQFEECLAAHFRQQGYKVDLTPYRDDFGADLIIERGGVRTAIQAKRWKGNVGVGAVQEIVSARGYYQCQQAMVVTNSVFTQAAQRLAVANGVTLWDRAALVRELSVAAVEQAAHPEQQLQG